MGIGWGQCCVQHLRQALPNLVQDYGPCCGLGRGMVIIAAVPRGAQQYMWYALKRERVCVSTYHRVTANLGSIACWLDSPHGACYRATCSGPSRQAAVLTMVLIALTNYGVWCRGQSMGPMPCGHMYALMQEPSAAIICNAAAHALCPVDSSLAGTTDVVGRCWYGTTRGYLY